MSDNMREVISIVTKGVVGVTASIGSATWHFGYHDVLPSPVFGWLTGEEYHMVMGNVSMTGGAVVAFLTAVSLWRKMPPRKRNHHTKD